MTSWSLAIERASNRAPSLGLGLRDSDVDRMWIGGGMNIDTGTSKVKMKVKYRDWENGQIMKVRI